ncbi:hypothetical protein EOM86_10830, partial [Candidatus Nomurabacteria bacterium]|nr:hypothetical protein [Candidatus Nomurabacteria bacterium]
MDQSQPSFHKSVVNAGIGLNNIIPPEHMYTDISAAFGRFIDILSHVLGPHSKYVSLDSGTIYHPIFTKDGIQIMESIESISPVDKIAAAALRAIGSYAEKKTGDGTTSSMIIAAMMIRQLNRMVYDSKQPPTFDQLEQAYRKVVTRIKSWYELAKYEPTTNEDRAGIAYSQTYTSSHGDCELAELMRTVCLNIDHEVYDYLIVESERVESEHRFKFTMSDAQYELEAPEIFNPRMNNTDLGTSFKATGAKLYVFNNTTIEVGDTATKAIQDDIRATLESGTPVCVLLPAGITAMSKIQWIEAASGKTAAFYTVANRGLDITDNHILRLILGEHGNETCIIRENVSVECNGVTMKLNGINDDNAHSFFRDKYVNKDPNL